MKITFITASLGAGGSERVVSILSNELSKRGNNIEVICLKYNDIFYKLNDNIKVTFAKKEIRHNFICKGILWLRKHIKESDTEMVIAFTEGVYCFTILALMGTGIPIISSERNEPSRMSTTRKFLRKLLLPHTDWLVVQTQKIKNYFPEKIKQKTSIIFNPVNENVFKLKESKKEDIIISVARLYPQKNQKLMIDAFARIANDFPTYKLVIYGEGPLRTILEKQIDKLNMQERILLPGRDKDVIAKIIKAKIFCLSSDYEGMSNSMVEAVCIGMPIISTKVSGTEELVTENENGILVECNDVDGFSNALRTILTDNDKIETYAVNSRAKGEFFYTENIVRQWIELIAFIKTNDNGIQK